MSSKHGTPDNFELLKDDFEQKFCKKWNEDPQLYIQFYHARIMDAMLLLISTRLNDNLNKNNEIEEGIKASLDDLLKGNKK